MKIYTEEQIRNSMNSMKTYIKVYDESVIDKIVENHIKALGGVELPSDEEIKNYALQHGMIYPYVSSVAKWMRDKIGGNNEQQ